ncbi:hypothetical protein C0995_010821, partial [Termitomyces sp. Mi166
KLPWQEQAVLPILGAVKVPHSQVAHTAHTLVSAAIAPHYSSLLAFVAAHRLPLHPDPWSILVPDKEVAHPALAGSEVAVGLAAGVFVDEIGLAATLCTAAGDP